jgi:signal peptidase
MRIVRFLGSVALWVAAALGVIAGGIWIAGQLGYVQPLIVISGSMEPSVGTGDLLIARSTPTGDVAVGDVVTLHSDMTGKLVTHRITEITPTGDGTWDVNMKGDANDEPDSETYAVGDRVWTPMIRIPQGGDVVSELMDSAVALPILLALFALLGLSLLDDEDVVAEPTDDPATVGDPPGERVGAAGEPRGGDGWSGRGVEPAPVVGAFAGPSGVAGDAALAELDVALAILGVDMAAIDAWVDGDHTGPRGDGDDATAVEAVQRDRSDDRLDLVMSG